MTFYGKTFTPPRHKDAKMNINPPEADFVSWCLCGNLFSAFGGSGLGSNLHVSIKNLFSTFDLIINFLHGLHKRGPFFLGVRIIAVHIIK